LAKTVSQPTSNRLPNHSSKGQHCKNNAHSKRADAQLLGKDGKEGGDGSRSGKEEKEMALYRQVDQNAVNELRGKISGPDYKEKLGEIVTSLYKISHTTYSDMPRGVIKDTLMRKLTCKTLMEILPGEVVGKIQKEMAEKKLTSDFETVVGLVVAA